MFKFFAIILLQILIFCHYGYGGFISDFENVLNAGINEGQKLMTEFPSAVRGMVHSANGLNDLCIDHHFNTPHDATPQLADTTFVLMTPTANYTYAMNQVGQIVQNPAFNVNLNTTIFSAGWQSSFNGSNSALYGIYNAYMCNGNFNFIAINTAAYLDSLVYPWSALNTAAIGKFAAIGIQQLTQVYPIAQIHLLGHSLGAQIVGTAARTFAETTCTFLPRVTGLDPAKPCFVNNPRLPTLHSGDAQFVDIIHTNPGICGIANAIGDVDFYPNGHNPIPTGCTTIVCAHERSWEYYSESLYPGNTDGFMAVNCVSQKALAAGACTGPEYPMGYACPSNARGNMYVQVNNAAPYGMNSIPLSQVQCASDDTGNSNIVF